MYRCARNNGRNGVARTSPILYHVIFTASCKFNLSLWHIFCLLHHSNCCPKLKLNLHQLLPKLKLNTPAIAGLGTLSTCSTCCTLVY
jgi:hypothetical protein